MGARTPRTRRQTARGVTLVEVATVVVIVGILAVIAVVAYRRRVAAARTAEATGMITEIRRGQEAHKIETGLYANVSQDLQSFYPAANPGKMVTDWGGPCTNCANGDTRAWDRINVRATAPVIFGYATVAGIGGGPMALLGPGATDEIGQAMASQSAAVGPTDPTFIALAEADANGDGVKCHVLGLSHSNHIVVVNEGE